jgi:SPP1 family predicted phage head-tail adaptor
MNEQGSIINQLSELITFRKPTRAANGKGQRVETFTDYLKALVKVEQVPVNETVDGERINVPNTFQFTGYNYSAVDETFRVMYDGTEYEIVSPPERFNRKIFMRIKVVKVFK